MKADDYVGTWVTKDGYVQAGLTVRDHIAIEMAKALIASNDEGAGDRISEIPYYAYAIADALIKVSENE